MISKLPPKGMRDFLPYRVEARQELMAKIKEAYSNFGFYEIETPVIEDLSLLLSKQGGDNEKLIYKILKRGEKLEKASQEDLCDLGLRFDLTLPLARYYANNISSLPPVVKAMHIGSVFRADRPQKGRFRQFVQCDIDVINEPSFLAEVELICATKSALQAIGLSDFTVLINDRRILKALASYAQFEESDWEKVFIEFDKLDKIGIEGVKKELLTFLPAEKIERFFEATFAIKNSNNPLLEVQKILGGEGADAAQNLNKIIEATNARFEATLVRGMNYYTGTIFEIYCGQVPYALAGGGRYDKLIEKISGVATPACGFSIGFERIAELLEDKIKIERKTRTAFIVEKKHLDDIKNIMQSIESYRANSACSLFVKAKNFAYQAKELKEKGYDFIKVYDGNNWND